MGNKINEVRHKNEAIINKFTRYPYLSHIKPNKGNNKEAIM
jgi:hypothetical protein